jgi:hypothetical protein
MLMFGGGHAATPRTDVEVLKFDTLAWMSSYPPTPVSEMKVANFNHENSSWVTTGHPTARHTYDLLSFATHTGELIMLKQTDEQPNCTEQYQWAQHPGRIWHYNPVSRIWRPSNAIPIWGTRDNYDVAPAAEYDPRSGKIIILSRRGLYTYDPVSEVVTKHLSFARGELGYAQNLIYFPPTDRMYNIKGDGRVFEIILNRDNFSRSTIVEVPVTGSLPKAIETGWAYDSVNESIGGGIMSGVFYAFDPRRNTWSSRKMEANPAGTNIGTQVFHCLDFDPVNGVFIFIARLGFNFTTWAYKPGPAA